MIDKNEMINNFFALKKTVYIHIEETQWKKVVFLLNNKWKKELKDYLVKIPKEQWDITKFYYPTYYLFGTQVCFVGVSEDEIKFVIENG